MWGSKLDVSRGKTEWETGRMGKRSLDVDGLYVYSFFQNVTESLFLEWKGSLHKSAKPTIVADTSAGLVRNTFMADVAELSLS